MDTDNSSQQQKSSFPGYKMLLLPVNILFASEDEDNEDMSIIEKECLSRDVNDFPSSMEEDNSTSKDDCLSSSDGENSTTDTLEFPIGEDADEPIQTKTGMDAQSRNDEDSQENKDAVDSPTSDIEEDPPTRKNPQIKDVETTENVEADPPTRETPQVKQEDTIEEMVGSQIVGRAQREGRVYSCTKCPYITTSSYNLTVHKRTHTNERPYTCPMCQWGFRTQSHLYRHTRNVDCTATDIAKAKREDPSQKPSRQRSESVTEFKCETCDYSTNLSYNLKVHQRSHTDERPYMCDKCDGKFRTQSHLYRHTRNHLRNATRAGPGRPSPTKQAKPQSRYNRGGAKD